MSLDDLDLAAWRALDPAAATRVAQEIGRRVGAERVLADGSQARFVRNGCEYHLVPGGEVTLGYDGSRFTPDRMQLEDYYWSLYYQGEFCDGDGDDEDPWENDDPEDPDEERLQSLVGRVRQDVDRGTSNPRRVTVPPLLVSKTVWGLQLDSYADAVAHVAEQGARLLTPDEWEHACGAGTSTLWWWGDHWPGSGYPCDCPLEKFGTHPFGLTIANTSYEFERTSEPTVLYGGDGGMSTCGGDGPFAAWLTLASAGRWVFPKVAEWDETDSLEIRIRPAIPL